MRLDVAGFAVRRWQFTLVAFALLAALGVNALLSTPRSEDPHFPLPVVSVQTVLPGAEPAEVEQLVVAPIEDAIEGLDSVAKIWSTSQDSSGLIVVEFNYDVDPERKYDEVVREVNALRGRLPEGLAQLEVRRARTTEVAIVQVALVSDTLPMRRLEKAAERLREQLARTPGVREARYWGVPPSEVRVSLDLSRLAALQLPATAVTDALRARGAEAPVGTLQSGEQRFNVKTGGSFKTLEAVAGTPVRSLEGRVVRVGDVATVSWAQDEADHLARFNGHRAVFVTVTQKDGEDVGRITAGVRRALDEHERTLPGSVKLERAFFQSENVDHRLDNLFRDFGIALGLVLITLLPLGLRAGVVVMVSIPLSLLIGLALIQAFGFTLNQLSIAGFVLALGLLVDDSIVVVENIARRMREGEDRITASINGTRQIGLAVIGCTAAVMLAFLPLMALPGAAGAYIRSLPATVLATVGASLVVALTVIPFLASRILSPDEAPKGNALLRAINGGIQRLYTPILHAGLARPYLTTALILGLCLTAIPMVRTIGTSLFPPAETPQFLVEIELPEGTALTRTDQALRYVDAVLAREPDVAWRASNLGRGNPQVYYNHFQRASSASYAEVFVGLKAWRPGHSEQKVARMREAFARYPGARITLVLFENGQGVEAPIEVRLTGESLDVLKAGASRIEQILKATPGARDVSNPLRVDRTHLDLGLDEGKAATLGVPTGAARRAIRLALTGEEVARFRDADGDDYPVKVRLAMAHTVIGDGNHLAALGTIYVPTATGEATPLSALASPQPVTGPARINHFKRERTVTVSAFLEPGALAAKVTPEVERSLAKIALPPGYRLSFGGQAEAQSESFSGLGAAITITIFGILALLVLEFGRFRSVLVVAGIIPLGLFGAVAALALTGNSLSFTATIGIIALIGIEIKNSILLVDFTEQLRREGVPLREAIERAGEVRFLPVLLTSVTAIGGLIPLALERSGLYSPLAIALIGGLISSTFLSRIATPVLYWLFNQGEAE
ncbi:MAG: efflux RND transporter permease subunit [Phenylobacterium sp.]|jgi:multidrug efflux pump subunit AcrB|uniref:efflux RND transporter permease subunit n=1 Tax=Phenylobacterium sp. TaxID=1871053 RepID=UPI0025F02289|nr:efflux RND transporter permease subunit [Phenylobacterium sp.]MCA6298810.1 efflux RND transporter permease subunit [Phenylobacterium sp.]